MEISGIAPMLSAASREFSTSSRTVVYKHLPGCKHPAVEFSSLRLLHAAGNRAHVIKARYIPMLCKELCWALLLQTIRPRPLGCHGEITDLPWCSGYPWLS